MPIILLPFFFANFTNSIIFLEFPEELNMEDYCINNKGEKLNLQEIFYNFCGDFDTKSKKNYNLGLFFMDRPGAEMYLSEIAKSDISFDLVNSPTSSILCSLVFQDVLVSIFPA